MCDVAISLIMTSEETSDSPEDLGGVGSEHCSCFSISDKLIAQEFET